MNQTNKTDTPETKWGGKREGAGRPKGSSNKIRIEDLIDSIESRSGMSFTDQVASNYVAAIVREDWARVENYDKALLNKVVADKSEITVEEIGDAVSSKAEAFKAAIEAISPSNLNNNINKTKDN